MNLDESTRGATARQRPRDPFAGRAFEPLAADLEVFCDFAGACAAGAEGAGATLPATAGFDGAAGGWASSAASPLPRFFFSGFLGTSSRIPARLRSALVC